jgi:hypothetical protein
MIDYGIQMVKEPAEPLKKTRITMTTKHKSQKPKKTKTKTRTLFPPDTTYMSDKERAETDAAYLKRIGYKSVTVTKHRTGYRVEARSKED